MQRIVDSPVARTLFQRGAVIAFSTQPDLVLMLGFSASGELGAQLHRGDDPALEKADCQLNFTPEALAAVAQGGACTEPPDITGKDEALARSVLMVLGIEHANTQLGGGGVGQQGGSFELSREAVLDVQLSRDRQVYSAFNAREPGPFDCRHWRVEAGIRSEGLAFAVSVGLTDPSTPLRPPRNQPEPLDISGLGHELLLLVDTASSQGGWHIGIVAAALREYARTERPFTAPDWIDYGRPLVRGGTVEGFLIVESKYLESPFALFGGKWARFFTMIGLTRTELDVVNTQQEPLRIHRLLTEALGNPEITDCFREPVPVW